MADHLRLRKLLDAPITVLPVPTGVTIVPLWQARPIELHALLRAAYATGGGTIGSFDDWWWPLVEDEEFDPALVITAMANGEPVGLIQCWTSSFVKDLVVAPTWRDQGLGAVLLNSAFDRLSQRGNTHVDLKVEGSNLSAQRFYRRHGMVEVA